MPPFLGFDTSIYPGDTAMQTLRTQALVAFTGFYLAPAPSHGDTSWMQKRAFLAGLGYGFAPVATLGNNFDIFFQIKVSTNSAPGQRLIVGNHGPDSLHDYFAVINPLRKGMAISTCNPPPITSLNSNE